MGDSVNGRCAMQPDITMTSDSKTRQQKGLQFSASGCTIQKISVPFNVNGKDGEMGTLKFKVYEYGTRPGDSIPSPAPVPVTVPVTAPTSVPSQPTESPTPSPVPVPVTAPTSVPLQLTASPTPSPVPVTVPVTAPTSVPSQPTAS